MFEQQREERLAREAPLAARMRPTTLDEFVGQGHIVGEGHVLRRTIEADQVPSIVSMGPAGHRQDHTRANHRAHDPIPL